MDGRLNKPLAIFAIIVALVLGVLVGTYTGIADRLFGGPNPKTIATASLESMRAQNRLTAFVARYVSVVSSEQQRFGGLVSSERTLVLPGDVRYELDEYGSRVVQHELDHLDGVLFVDHLTSLRRNMLMRKLAKEQKAKAAG